MSFLIYIVGQYKSHITLLTERKSSYLFPFPVDWFDRWCQDAWGSDIDSQWNLWKSQKRDVYHNNYVGIRSLMSSANVL